MVGTDGIEPSSSGFSVQHSDLLSYIPVWWKGEYFNCASPRYRNDYLCLQWSLLRFMQVINLCGDSGEFRSRYLVRALPIELQSQIGRSRIQRPHK